MQIHIISCGFGLSFLLEYPQGLYLIDSGSPGMQAGVFKKMKALGRSDLRLIWITHSHYDHYGSAAAIREQTGAAIGIHPADAPYMACGLSPLGAYRSYGFIYPFLQTLLNRIWRLTATRPDFTLEDDETLESYGLPATILHTPGHTPGHTCLLLADGTAFVGDLLGRTCRRNWHQHETHIFAEGNHVDSHRAPSLALQGLLATNWEQLPGSLARLQRVRPARVYTGHLRQAVAGSLILRLSP